MPGYLLLFLLFIFVLQPLLPVVSEAVEGDRSSVGAAVVLGVFVPLQQWWYGAFLFHRPFKLRQSPQWQHCHGNVVEEPLADGMSACWARVAVKHAEQHTAAAWQTGGTAPTVLIGDVGWQRIAMETQNTMGGGASGEGVAVFVGLAIEDRQTDQWFNWLID